ncbi:MULTISPECIES: alpha/beta hydrolase [unclassified Sphingomonas]|uniref:alpha/beta hydrolase n=1 Tax=unclassified Sphingomonas TaxID=196159 RepID=UPI0018D25C8C|nr:MULTISPECIES: alpha/beta hydrolase [unclassified Sphingomonas]
MPSPETIPHGDHAESAVDPAFAALLADSRTALRAPTPGLPIEVMRAAANKFMARAQGPQDVAVEDRTATGRAGSIATRLYRPAGADAAILPVTLFVHGGGFVLGSLDSHDATCRALCVATGMAIVALDYRLAPEHPFPAALDDVADVLAWIGMQAAALRVDAGRIALAGDSAGAQLVLATLVQRSDIADTVGHAALLYPLLDPSAAAPSQREYGDGYMLTRPFIDYAWSSYGAARLDEASDYLRLGDDALAGLPPMTFVLAGCDPLRDEGEAMARRLQQAGVEVQVHRFDGMIHGFAGLPQFTPRAGEAIELIGSQLAGAMRRAAA